MTGSGDDERKDEEAVDNGGEGAPGPEGGKHPASEGEEEAGAAESEGDQPGGEAPDEPVELDLGDEDAALPWLEGDDDDEEYEGHGSGQLITLVLLGLLAIGVVVGGGWWVLHRHDEREIAANGSVIPAPATPYKQRPKNPGGKTFPGTGDTSFAVSEGETRPARLGAGTPEPGFDTIAKGTPESKSATEKPVGVGVQIGAFSTHALAETGWRKLSQEYDVLADLHHRVVEGQADIGTVYRLQALAKDAAAAKTLCHHLRSAGLNCEVKD